MLSEHCHNILVNTVTVPDVNAVRMPPDVNTVTIPNINAVRRLSVRTFSEYPK